MALALTAAQPERRDMTGKGTTRPPDSRLRTLGRSLAGNGKEPGKSPAERAPRPRLRPKPLGSPVASLDKTAKRFPAQTERRGRKGNITVTKIAGTQRKEQKNKKIGLFFKDTENFHF